MKVLKTQALKPVEILQDAGYIFMPVCNSNKLIGLKNVDWEKVKNKIQELDNALDGAAPEQKLMNKYYLNGEETFWTACFTYRELNDVPGYDRMEIHNIKHFKQVLNSCIACSTVETEAYLMYMSDELMDNRDESDFFDLKNIGDVEYE